MIREVRQLSAVVGRRTALKYAGLGLVTAALTACGADGLPGSGGGPKKAMITAFVKGKWKIAAEGGTCVLTVKDGTWAMSEGKAPAGSDGGMLTRPYFGTYQIDSGVLTVAVNERDDPGEPDRGTGTALPEEVSDSEEFSASWSYHNDTFNVPVRWDGKKAVVQVTHQQYGGLIVLTAERT
jgi:hypothetical protein